MNKLLFFVSLLALPIFGNTNFFDGANFQLVATAQGELEEGQQCDYQRPKKKIAAMVKQKCLVEENTPNFETIDLYCEILSCMKYWEQGRCTGVFRCKP